ncbi:MAG: hypothetical protein L0Y55_13325, partial [Anaerolineales bacterium]|nr:hypothetical protein [Anaerolineales bacterium]
IRVYPRPKYLRGCDSCRGVILYKKISAARAPRTYPAEYLPLVAIATKYWRISSRVACSGAICFSFSQSK